MKKIVRTMLTVAMTFVLSVSLRTGEVFAKGDYVESNYETDESVYVFAEPVNEFEILGKKQKKFATLERGVNNLEMNSFSIQTVAQNDGLEDVSAIYNGTITGYLSEKDDYKLYPANLESGEYLQARLSLPDVEGIDYDLLLFDSSLSFIKSSDYVTYINSNGTLAESIGYIAARTETVYICVYSVLGGSTTEAYTLDYAITTNFTEQGEPSENAKEAYS